MPKKDAKNKETNEETSGEEGSQEAASTTDVQELNEDSTNQPTEKEKLLVLYQTLKDLGINSISDLEVKISRLN